MKSVHVDDDNFIDTLKRSLIGRYVVAADFTKGWMELDDGTELQIEPNIGGCICSAGDYDLADMTVRPNAVIMNVEHVEERFDDDFAEGRNFQVFVYFEGMTIRDRLYQVTGDDGNGYYGTGYTLIVKKATP